MKEGPSDAMVVEQGYWKTRTMNHQASFSLKIPKTRHKRQDKTLEHVDSKKIQIMSKG